MKEPESRSGTRPAGRKAPRARQPDAVDRILQQWAAERPDLDASPMGPIGRLLRCMPLLERQMEAGYGPHGLSRWEFDVLATLRRHGAPYRMSPTELFSSLMVSSGTMTHRMRRLEERKLVQRVASDEDARSMPVQLTRQGLALIDRAVESHVDNERRILAELPPAALAALDEGLAALLQALETAGDEDNQ